MTEFENWEVYMLASEIAGTRLRAWAEADRLAYRATGHDGDHRELVVAAAEAWRRYRFAVLEVDRLRGLWGQVPGPLPTDCL